MPDTERLRIETQLLRRPAECDPSDVEALRAWSCSTVEAIIALQGRLPHAGRWFRREHEEFGSLEDLVEMGKEDATTVFWHQLGQREGIVAYLREGELNLRDEGGSMRRTAVVLQAMGDGGWWLATRPFGTDRVGVGQLHGPWTYRTGRGAEELPEGLVEWFHSERAEFGEIEQSEFAPPEPDLDIRAAYLPPLVGELGDAPQVAIGLGRACDAEVLGRGLTCHIVFAVTDDALERWELRGDLPCSIDDVVRNIIRMSSPRAVALVTPGVCTTDEGTKRAVHTHAEVPGTDQRARRILIVDFESDGTAKAAGEVVQQRGLSPTERWFGVTPATELELTPLGFESDGRESIGDA